MRRGYSLRDHIHVTESPLLQVYSHHRAPQRRPGDSELTAGLSPKKAPGCFLEASSEQADDGGVESLRRGDVGEPRAESTCRDF